VLPNFITGKPIWFESLLNVIVFICLLGCFSNAFCENTERENSNPKVTDVKDLNMFLIF
jgi:hypothetical protein